MEWPPTGVDAHGKEIIEAERRLGWAQTTKNFLFCILLQRGSSSARFGQRHTRATSATTNRKITAAASQHDLLSRSIRQQQSLTQVVPKPDTTYVVGRWITQVAV